MSCLGALCGPCQKGCTPICNMCKGLEGKCDISSYLECGPSCPCKTVGAELTLGMKALEDLCGVIHISTTMFPGFLPSFLYPLCMGTPACPCCIGQDETKSGDDFAPGGPTQTDIKICKALLTPCTNGPCCKPHMMLSQHMCGLMMDPIFAGNAPFWFCKETTMPSIKFTGAVHPK